MKRAAGKSLKFLMLEKDGSTGYGIATGTALRVFPDGRMEALGGAVHQYVSRGGKVKRIGNVQKVGQKVI